MRCSIECRLTGTRNLRNDSLLDQDTVGVLRERSLFRSIGGEMTIREFMRDVFDCFDLDDDLIFLCGVWYEKLEIDYERSKNNYCVLRPKEEKPDAQSS